MGYKILAVGMSILLVLTIIMSVNLIRIKNEQLDQMSSSLMEIIHSDK